MKIYSAIAILIGTCIGAGFLGIPYVASKSGFPTALIHIIIIGATIMLVNLYLGEVTLRTKGKHQLAGYAQKYLGKTGSRITEFAIIFSIYSAIIAYTLGIGESISFLITGNANQTLLYGILTGIIMSTIIWMGIEAFKKLEKIGVATILILLIGILITYLDKIKISNLQEFNPSNILLPFGVILFALLSFQAIPEAESVLTNQKKKLKKAIIIATLTSITFYIIFTFIIVGFKGTQTPEIATLALGTIFILLGILTMFTSYLALGNILKNNLIYDKKFKKPNALLISTIIPLILFIIIKALNLLSFTKVLSIGGVITGGTIGIISILMNQKAKKLGNRKPEYQIPINRFIITIIILFFTIGIIQEIFSII